MLLPISLIFAGILLGILLRRTAIPGIAGRIFTPVVVLLLFAMGCAIGRNRTVMDNLPRLGLDAFILATASVAGSVIAVLLISRYLPRPGRDRETADEGKSSHRGLFRGWHSLRPL